MPEAASTFSSAPPDRIEVVDHIALVRCRPHRAAAAVATNASLEHLQPWMAWAAEPATEAGLATFFVVAEELWDQHQDFAFTLVEGPDEAVIGGCGLHGRIGPTALEIGYWVHVDRIGRGLATAAARALTDAAFAIDGIERAEIHCDDLNVRSARVPAKLGYHLTGVVVPEEGPFVDRPTQEWRVEREAWVAGPSGGAS